MFSKCLKTQGAWLCQMGVAEHWLIWSQSLKHYRNGLNHCQCELKGCGFVKGAWLTITTFKARAKAPCPKSQRNTIANASRIPQWSERNSNGSVYVLHEDQSGSSSDWGVLNIF